LEHRVLRRDGEEVTLRPKSFEVLAQLINRSGQLITKAELIETVWPDTAVTDNSLAQCMVEIRRALDDDSQQLIRTVARRGYVFAARVTTPIGVSPRQPGLSHEPAPLTVAPSASTGKWAKPYALGAGVVALLALGIVAFRLAPKVHHEPAYTQITNVTDSAIAPALSPDGRMVAFLRSDRWFASPDQIYVKLLPDGEPVQLTHDRRQKYGMAFSPDGSRIAYSVVERSIMGWNTYTVSVLGGEPTLLLSNASGLTWLDRSRYLFSEQDGKGAHMGIVIAGENRSQYRQIYFPPHERSMAHFSFASPDRKWALVAEMDPIWHRCRLIPLDGSSTGREVGPNGHCMSAAWSPDGRWMYFGADVTGDHHLWRQRFPGGDPEQITHGPTQEDGVAVAADGRSLITSIGIQHSVIWIHDSQGDRPLHSEGYLAGMHLTTLPSVRFSPNGKSVFYLMQRDSPQSPRELWRTDLESSRHEAVLRGLSIMEYDLSSDGREVVFSTQSSGVAPQIWVALLDRSAPPKLVTTSGGAWPVFGPDSQVLFLWSDGTANYLVRIGRDGSNRSKVVPYSVGNIDSISPDRRWIAVMLGEGTVVLPTAGGNPRPVYRTSTPAVAWSADGKYFYLGVQARSLASLGKTVVLPVPPGKTLPELPRSGILGMDEAKALPGARILDGWDIAPGPDPSVFAYTKTTVHRNLYRISIP
jgi:DNA-binding winged helix-turn-helix (wHTH) protein/Tol biopolymer transport system component